MFTSHICPELQSNEIHALYDKHQKESYSLFSISFFIKSILKSLVILGIWLTLGGVIYSQIAPFFALNRIFFSANENGTVKQNNQSDFKVSLTSPIKFQENKRQKATVFRICNYRLMPKLCCCVFSVSKLTKLINYSFWMMSSFRLKTHFTRSFQHSLSILMNIFFSNICSRSVW